MQELFHTLVYIPLYNGLIFFVGHVPMYDVGIAVIALTLLVRIILSPLSLQASRTQKATREAAPDIEKIKEKFKDNKEEQARAIFALYREKKIRPFSTLFLTFLQIPILIGLYWVFWKGGLPEVDETLLYSFITAPSLVHMTFLGVFNMGTQSMGLAFFAGATQLIHARLTMGPAPEAKPNPSFSDDFARSMHLQMRFIFPIMIGVFGYLVTAAVPLYFITSNLFLIGQEVLFKQKTP